MWIGSIPCFAQQPAKTFSVPFHTVNSMILLDATVNDKPAILLLDTGSNHTLVSAPLAGVSVPLKPATIGIGVERQLVRTTVKFGPGEYIAVEAVNLSTISKKMPIPSPGWPSRFRPTRR